MKIIIVEDNVETLGVLRDFVRSLDTTHDVQVFSSGNALLEQRGPIQADLLVLGYDLGPSVTGTELLHYLQWSSRLSAKSHVAFLSNTIELARRQAPLRFTQTYFHEKPMSLMHLQDAVAWARENQSVFSGVFYLIDKQRWQSAFNSLQLCKENVPSHLQQQAWLLECMLLLKLRHYAKVIRRYPLIQDYPWAPVVRLWALSNLGQLRASRHAFNGMAGHDAYYSAALALFNQLSTAAHTRQPSFIPNSIKESELSLFEIELKAFSLVLAHDFNEASNYLHGKKKRVKRDSHQAYFYAIATLKAALLQVLKEPTASVTSTLPVHMQNALTLLTERDTGRDEELNSILWPKLIAHIATARVYAEHTTQLKIGPVVTDPSPISLIVRIYLHWVESGELFINQLESCIELIEAQIASGRAVCNQLIFEKMLSFIVADPEQRVRLSNSLANRLSKQGRYEHAAFALSRALRIHPESPTLRKKLALCCQRLEVKQFLDHA